VFCVTILRADQTRVSDRFAGRGEPPNGNRFSVAEWVPMSTGAPRVGDVLTAFDCRVQSAERVGTHHVIIGAVQDIYVADVGSPLIYSNRAYGAAVRLLRGSAPPHAPAAPAPDAMDTLHVGVLQTFGPFVLPAILRGLRDEGAPIDVRTLEADQRQLLRQLRAEALDLAFLYAFDLGDDIQPEPLADLTPYVLLPQGHPLADESDIALERLVSEPLVLLDVPPSRDYFLSFFKDVGAPHIAYTAQSVEMVRGLVGHGLGYSLLATKPASAMSYDGKALVMRPIADDVPVSRLVAGRKKGRPLSPAAETLLAHCRAVFGRAPEESPAVA